MHEAITSRKQLSGHDGPVTALAADPNGRVLASGSNSQIRLWGLPDTELITVLKLPRKGEVERLTFSSDGQWLVSGSTIETVDLWSVSQRTHVRTLDRPGWESTSSSSPVAVFQRPSQQAQPEPPRTERSAGKTGFLGWLGTLFTQGGSARGKIQGDILVTGGSDALHLWHFPSGDFIKTVSGWNGGSILALACENASGLVAAGGRGVSGGVNTVFLLQLTSGRLLKRLSGHQGAIFRLAFSPDAQILASGAGDSTVKLWNLPDGSLVTTLEAHEDWVMGLAFSPDGSILASAGRDGKICLWGMPEGELLASFHEDEDEVNGLVFGGTPDFLASACDDGFVDIWQLSSRVACRAGRLKIARAKR